jgi:ABC-type nickel/cobalt efflux system permease component RcnA
MYKGVQWFFSLQAVIIDGRGIWDARRRSAQLVHRNWWKALGMVVLVTLLSGAPGPAAGMVLFVTEVVSIETAGVISSVLFAISYPIAIIASTRLYLQLRDGASDAMTVGTANRVWNRTRSIWSRLQPAS